METSSRSFGGRGEEAGGKVNQAGSKLLRGQAGGEGLSDTTGSPGGGGQAPAKLPRLPPPPAQPQATAGKRDGRRETVNMNGHPGRVMIRDTDPTGATRGSQAVDRRGKRLLPRGTEARSSPICPLCARRHDLAPKPPRLLSRGQADSRCHHSPRPARRPAQAAVS